MSLPIIILLLVVGFLFVLLEILIIPGTSIAGFIGFGALIYGIYAVFVEMGTTAGWIALASVLLVCTLLIAWVWKTKSWRFLALNDKLEKRVNNIDPRLQVGDEGYALSRLAPMGKASFGEEDYEVESVDGFLDEKTPVKVKKIDGRKIYVSR